jgi:hypothetical protein
MLDEPELRRLADDITANGLRHPIVLDDQGRVLDGRNRLAACDLAGVEPEFALFPGDPLAFVVSENNERRHMTVPQRAAAVALTLASDGKRQNGRWRYGSASVEFPESGKSWSNSLSRAGVVLDENPDELPEVVTGAVALDDAYRRAVASRKERERRDELPTDLRALVDAGTITVSTALRRAALPDRYAQLVADQSLALDEAEHLATRDQREHADAVRRQVQSIEAFLASWRSAALLTQDPNRDEVLAELAEFDRDRFLTIEKETSWPSNRI